MTNNQTVCQIINMALFWRILAASTTPASGLDSPRRSQEIHSLCRRIAFKQNVFNLNSRSISNDTMRDFFQDLKERNRVERVRHYQNERKHEREKRWYRLRGSNVSNQMAMGYNFISDQ
jgi:hypothetical protein